MKKADYIKKLKEQVANTDIERIAALRMDVMKGGGSYKAICPFHSDDSVGSFVLGGRVNKYKCFACGASGDGLDLIQHTDSTSFMDALIAISEELEYITPDKARRLRQGGRGSWSDKDISTANFHPFEATEQPETNMAEPEVLHKVFSLFSEGMALDNGSRLSEAHQAYLIARGLGEDEIKASGFFTFPNLQSGFIKRFYNELYTRFGYTPDILENVPGFFTAINFCVDAKKVGYVFADSHPEFDAQLFAQNNGIGIPIRDVEGRIVGIQIRQDNGGVRYKWFSSAQVEANCTNATSSGAPKDVVYPTEMKNTTLFITEGKFKALTLAKTFGSVVISIQGVSSWRGIEDMIPAIEEHIGQTFNHVIVAYDADMAYNDAVAKQTLALGEALDAINTATVHVALWNPDLGKGIDDLIQNGQVHKLSRLVFPAFKEKIEKMMKITTDRKVYFTQTLLTAVNN